MRKDLFINPIGEESDGTKLIQGPLNQNGQFYPHFAAKEGKETISKEEHWDWTCSKSSVQNCCKIQNYL